MDLQLLDNIKQVVLTAIQSTGRNSSFSLIKNTLQSFGIVEDESYINASTCIFSFNNMVPDDVSTIIKSNWRWTAKLTSDKTVLRLNLSAPFDPNKDK